MVGILGLHAEVAKILSMMEKHNIETLCDSVCVNGSLKLYKMQSIYHNLSGSELGPK